MVYEVLTRYDPVKLDSERIVAKNSVVVGSIIHHLTKPILEYIFAHLSRSGFKNKHVSYTVSSKS